MIGRRTQLLGRVFFDRLFEHDGLASSTPASTAGVWLVAAMATPGLMASASQYYTYAHARAFSPDVLDRLLFLGQAFHVAFAMAMAGVVAMLVWTSVTPDRRDAVVLGPLPVRSGELAWARLLALGAVFALFVVAVAVPAGVGFTIVTLGDDGGLIVRVIAHVSAVGLGAGLVFFGVITMQLGLAAIVGPRAVAGAAWALQVAAIVALVSAVSFSPRLVDPLLAADAGSRAAVMWNPVAWFTGLYRWLSGDAREVFAVLASRGVLASAIVTAAALVAWPLAQRRALIQVLAGERRHGGAWTGAGERLWLQTAGPWLRGPLERALAAFVIATLTRSATHRAVAGVYAGLAIVFALPLAGALTSLGDDPVVAYAWFSVPLGLLCWTMAGVRVAMMVPIEPGANWTFRLTEPVEKGRVLSVAITVLLGTSAVPFALGFGTASAWAGGPALGAQVFAVVLATGLVLAELLTLTLRTVPCTCTYRPGQLRLRLLWPVYLMTWVTIAYLFPRLAHAAPDRPTGAVWLVSGLLACWAALRLWRSARARRLAAFVYDEADPSVTTAIDLSGVRG